MMRKTYIVPSSQVRSIQQDLITNQGILVGVQVLPFEAACLEHIIPSNELEIKCFEVLQQHSFELLGFAFTSPSFIKTMISFSLDLKCYDITLDMLPQNTQRERELYTAFSLLEPLIPNLTLPSDTVYYSQDGLSHAQISYLSKTPAIPMPIKEKTPAIIEAFEALNFRQELEGAIQYILKHNYDHAVLAVFNLDSIAPYVESCFQRYGIPIKIQNRQFDVVKHQFLALVQHYTKHDMPSILALIESGALNLRNPFKLTRYIKHYKLHLSQLYEPFDYAQKSDLSIVQDILNLQDAIQDDSIRLRQYLLETRELSLKEFIVDALNRINTLHPEETGPLTAYLQEVYSLISHESLPVICNHIQTLQSPIKGTPSIQVVDVNAIPQSINGPLIILGLSSKAYPNLASLTGVIDERYVQNIKLYPTLETRNAFNLDLKRRIFSKTNHLILSFPHATYDGKGLEAAYDAEMLLKHAQVRPKPWLIHETQSGDTPLLKIIPELAEQLYVKDSCIHGSVSSFELYVNDPIKHFLKFGLGLQEPPSYELDARLFGTLNHAYFERILSQKDANLWDVYQSYLPFNDATFSIIRELNNEILELHRDIITQAQSTTEFVPAYFEQRFRGIKLFDGISLNGIIDRIDVSNDRFIIVDYKSSNQTLKSDLIQSGQQLQLLTYALIARLIYKLPVQGVFYYSLAQSSIRPNTLGYSKTKGITNPEPVTEADRYKAYGYKGWFFMDPDTLFTDASFYSGLMYRKKDESFYIYGNPYDIERVKDYFQELYAYLRNQILSGNLDARTFTLPLYSDYSFKQGDDTDGSNIQ